MSILLEQAIERIKAGDKATGLNLLTQEIKQNPKNETAWLWMSYCVSDVNQKKDCFKQVLAINPNNEAARRELEKLSPPQSPPIQSPISNAKQSAVPSSAPPSFKKQTKQTKSTNFSTVSMVLMHYRKSHYCMSVCFYGTLCRLSPDMG